MLFSFLFSNVFYFQLFVSFLIFYYRGANKSGGKKGVVKTAAEKKQMPTKKSNPPPPPPPSPAKTIKTIPIKKIGGKKRKTTHQYVEEKTGGIEDKKRKVGFAKENQFIGQGTTTGMQQQSIYQPETVQYVYIEDPTQTTYVTTPAPTFVTTNPIPTSAPIPPPISAPNPAPIPAPIAAPPQFQPNSYGGISATTGGTVVSTLLQEAEALTQNPGGQTVGPNDQTIAGKKKPNGYWALPAVVDTTLMSGRKDLLQVNDCAFKVWDNEFVAVATKYFDQSGFKYPAIHFACKNEAKADAPTYSTAHHLESGPFVVRAIKEGMRMNAHHFTEDKLFEVFGRSCNCPCNCTLEILMRKKSF